VMAMTENMTTNVNAEDADYKTYIKSLIILALFGFLYFFELGSRPFATPDEARYVEIPREMVASGDWITPRLNGVKYFEKPPLLYWLQGLTQKAVGLNEWSMRLWPVLFALMGLLGTYLFTRRYFTRQAAVNTVLILGSSVLYFALSRLIVLDMPISVITTLGLYSFYTAFFTPEHSPKRRLWFYAFSLCCALGMLIKGLMALALMGPIIVIWLSVTRGWGMLRPFYPFSAAIIFLAIAAPWHILAAIENPEFLHKYFVVEHFMRYTTTMHMRYQPMWYFIPIVLIGFLPWTGFLLSTARNCVRDIRQNQLLAFLWIWVIWIFGFFSISNSKLIPYILPVFPPLAILIAQHFENASKKTLCISTAIMLVVMGVGLIGAEMLFPELGAEKKELGFYLQFIGVVMLLGGAVVFDHRKRLKQKTLHAMLIIQFFVALTMIKASPFLQRPTTKNMAEYIKTHKHSDDSVVSFICYLQDLPVYTSQTVTVVEAKGELEFGTQVEDTTGWMIDLSRFFNLWHEKTLWIVSRVGDFETYIKSNPELKWREIMRENGLVLFTNKEQA